MGQDKLILRALEPNDIDLVYKWENDPQIWTYSAAHTPFSRHALTQYIMESQSGDFYVDRQLRLMAEVEGLTVGCIDLFDYEPSHHKAGVGLMVDAAQRGNGYGLLMLRHMKKYAHEELQLHQLYCHVSVQNTASLTLFERSGFTCIGSLKDWIYNSRNQKYEDAVMLQIIL